jgi:hypothetical protein
MSINHKLTCTVQSDESGSQGGYDNESGTTEIVLDVGPLPASTSNQAITLAFTVSTLQSIYLVSDKGCTLRTNGTGTSEVQTLSITGTPTGGTFALGYSGEVTGPIAYNASSATVQTALRALAAIGSTGVTCSGGPLPGSAVTITFGGTLANTNVSAITSDLGAGLTGGSSPAIAVTTTTPGKPSDVITLVAGIPLVWGRSAGYYACPFTTDVTTAYVSCTASARLQGKILTS